MATAWARNLRSRMPCAPRASVRCACLLTTMPWIRLPLPSRANELIPACEFEGDVDAFIAVDVPNLERLGDAARVHESAGAHFTLVTMRLKLHGGIQLR